MLSVIRAGGSGRFCLDRPTKGKTTGAWREKGDAANGDFGGHSRGAKVAGGRTPRHWPFPHFVLAGATLGAMLACQALAVWFMMLAYGMNLPIAAGGVVLLIVRLGTMIPNAPANIGSFQFFTVVALGMFGVEETLAAAFSIADFVVLTVPLWLLGLVALTKSGLTIASLRKEVSRLGTWKKEPNY